MALMAGAQVISAQQPASPDSISLSPPALLGAVENAGGQLRLNLVNTDETRGFQGTARVSLGNAAQFAEVAKVAVSLGPRQARIFPLTASSAPGDQFMLMIYDAAGALIFSKMAPVKLVNDPTPTINETAVSTPPPATPALATKGEVNVQARLAGGETENAPLVLAFDITAPAPVVNASFSVKAKGLQKSKPVTIRGQVSVEFSLPDAFDDRKVSYTLTDAAGQVVARGEADLDRLMSEDYASVADMKLDREAYGPGDQVRVVLALQGNTQHGYRLEVAAKEERGAIFYRDTRKGTNDGGKSSQEFTINLPSDARGPLMLEFKVFDAETGVLFDSGDREIPLAKANGGPVKTP